MGMDRSKHGVRPYFRAARYKGDVIYVHHLRADHSVELMDELRVAGIALRKCLWQKNPPMPRAIAPSLLAFSCVALTRAAAYCCPMAFTVHVLL